MQCAQRINARENIQQLPANFHLAVEKAQGKPIVFVTILGPYEIGKSSIIKKLTGDNGIQIGNGLYETTTGIMLHGPYPYNQLRKSFEMETIEDNDTQVFFVDTEGFAYFSDTKHEQEYISILNKLFAPYFALSIVNVLMVRRNLVRSEIKYVKDIINVIETCQSKSNHNQNPKLISLCTNVLPQWEVDARNKFIENIGAEADYTEFLTLPQFDIQSDLLNQSQEFNNSFKIFAQALLKSIEEVRNEFTFDSESAFQVFNEIVQKE
ncbi:hypothetical protein GPJ56_007914 [Histomonas meleagridis]|uniref:uncharacterized protein n=1 Tax=Histomonas meleagridis TaxID=135588 RepID=UPI003559CAA1|nr:hypothetical protein GPJ56_007914 [Histomonas meleagridis]KAH0803856.1 hypothetical protein GO595_002686 [Histomonas meleagridis]